MTDIHSILISVVVFISSVMAIKYDLAVGLRKGHKTTKNVQKPRPSRRKGVSKMITYLLSSIPHYGRKLCIDILGCDEARKVHS